MEPPKETNPREVMEPSHGGVTCGPRARSASRRRRLQGEGAARVVPRPRTGPGSCPRRTFDRAIPPHGAPVGQRMLDSQGSSIEGELSLELLGLAAGNPNVDKDTSFHRVHGPVVGLRKDDRNLVWALARPDHRSTLFRAGSFPLGPARRCRAQSGDSMAVAWVGPWWGPLRLPRVRRGNRGRRCAIPSRLLGASHSVRRVPPVRLEELEDSVE